MELYASWSMSLVYVECQAKAGLLPFPKFPTNWNIILCRTCMSPYLPSKLYQIGLELDEMERKFMQEGGMMSEEYQKFAAEGSGNVAADGMFSIQVTTLQGHGYR
jgi:hypothetical protein